MFRITTFLIFSVLNIHAFAMDKPKNAPLVFPINDQSFAQILLDENRLREDSIFLNQVWNIFLALNYRSLAQEDHLINLIDLSVVSLNLEQAVIIANKLKRKSTTALVFCGVNAYYGLNGNKIDKSKPFKFYKKASKENNPLGHFLLGRCYHLGSSVKIDLKKALELYQLAASFELCAASTRLALSIDYQNLGLPNDETQVIDLLKKGAIYDNDSQANVVLKLISPIDKSLIDFNLAYRYLLKISPALENYKKNINRILSLNPEFTFFVFTKLQEIYESRPPCEECSKDAGRDYTKALKESIMEVTLEEKAYRSGYEAAILKVTEQLAAQGIELQLEAEN